MKEQMMIERIVRGVAGMFILISTILGYMVHPGFYVFTAFVGLNLFQSAFSNWCPLIAVLRKAGLSL
jgi:hypothetical protein